MALEICIGYCLDNIYSVKLNTLRPSSFSQVQPSSQTYNRCRASNSYPTGKGWILLSARFVSPNRQN
jgi:hypothetical protein